MVNDSKWHGLNAFVARQRGGLGGTRPHASLGFIFHQQKDEMKKFLVVIIALLALAIIPASAGAVTTYAQWNFQNDANAQGGWSTTYINPAPAFNSLGFYECARMAPLGSGSPIYVRRDDGKGGPFEFKPLAISGGGYTTAQISSQVREFYWTGSRTLKSQRVWIWAYNAWQKTIRWTIGDIIVQSTTGYDICRLSN